MENKPASSHQPTRFLVLIRDNGWLYTFLVCALIFIYLAVAIHTSELMPLDQAAYVMVVTHMRSPYITPAMQALSQLASPLVLLVITLAIAAFVPKRQIIRCMAINLACIVIINLLLKYLIARPRPLGYRLIQETGYSFPSGHSMVAVAFFGLLIWLIWRLTYNKKQAWVYSCFFAIIALGIGFSRIYLGVHYASDVLAGFCIALAWLIVYVKLFASRIIRPVL